MILYTEPVTIIKFLTSKGKDGKVYNNIAVDNPSDNYNPIATYSLDTELSSRLDDLKKLTNAKVTMTLSQGVYKGIILLRVTDIKATTK